MVNKILFSWNETALLVRSGRPIIFVYNYTFASLYVHFTIKDILYLNTMNNANMRILTVIYYDYIYKQNT